MDWEPISTAPDLERIWVAGWQKPSSTHRGYWWWQEDCADNGKGIEHPNALLWCPIVLPPLPKEAPHD